MPALACTSTEVLLSHIGARTEHIRIGSGALLLPHYKPMKVAESFHMLAALYPGRIDLGHRAGARWFSQCRDRAKRQLLGKRSAAAGDVEVVNGLAGRPV